MNMLKYLSNKRWGSDGQILLRTYRTMIRPKIDYGCNAYASARSLVLTPLDVIHNSALRLIFGAFRTTPVNSLYTESGEAPLYLRRQISTLVHAMKNTKTILTTANEDGRVRTNRNNLCGIPFNERIKACLAQWNLSQLPPTSPLRTTITPPWNIRKPEINDKLTMYNKCDTPDSTYVTNFQKIINGYSNCDILYTDASNIGTNTGASNVTPTGTITIKLPDVTTILTAELHAIWKALHHIENSRHTKWLIVTDSLSSLSLLPQTYTKNLIAANIRDTLHSLST
nr:unnamed protein product [Callosobruchus chinensis]